MAFEIVDGMTGTKHISSDDLAALNTAMAHYLQSFRSVVARASDSYAAAMAG